MGGDTNSWMLSDGRPRWRPAGSSQDDRLLERMAWAKNGTEYQSMVAKFLDSQLGDISFQMDAWRKTQKGYMSPLKTWKPGNRDQAAEAAQNLRDSEPMRAWWLDRARDYAQHLESFGKSRLSPAPQPEFVPGTKPTPKRRESLAAWGRLLAQFAAKYTPRSHTRLKPVEGSAFIVESVPGPARVLFAEHQLGADPDMAQVKEFPFPAFLLDVDGYGWNQIDGPKLELLPRHPETGKPLKVSPGLTDFKRNFLAHHRFIPVPLH
jgi:hypothetical protein